MIDFDPEKYTGHPFVAGLLGALIGLRFAPGIGWLDRCVNILAGAVTAGYIGPALADVLDLEKPVLQSALAFAIGMFGMSIAAAIMQGIRELQLSEIFRDFLRRIFGGT